MTEKKRGRPKGLPKTGGGSRLGRPNKATVARESEIKAGGLTPLDYMLSVLRNSDLPESRRDWASAAAAPYCHPRLSQVDANLTGQLDVRGWMQKLGEPD